MIYFSNHVPKAHNQEQTMFYLVIRINLDQLEFRQNEK